MASEWQPIETAPKDGTEFLGSTKFGVRIMRWDDCKYQKRAQPYFAGSGLNRPSWDRAYQPTHLMPLPDPPKERA